METTVPCTSASCHHVYADRSTDTYRWCDGALATDDSHSMLLHPKVEMFAIILPWYWQMRANELVLPLLLGLSLWFLFLSFSFFLGGGGVGIMPPQHPNDWLTDNAADRHFPFSPERKLSSVGWKCLQNTVTNCHYFHVFVFFSLVFLCLFSLCAKLGRELLWHFPSILWKRKFLNIVCLGRGGKWQRRNFFFFNFRQYVIARHITIITNCHRRRRRHHQWR